MNREAYIRLFNELESRGAKADISNLNVNEFTGFILKTYRGNELNALLLTVGDNEENLSSENNMKYFNEVKENLVKVLAVEYLDSISLETKSQAIKDIVVGTGYEDELLELLSNVNMVLYSKKIRELNEYLKNCTFNKCFSFEVSKKSSKVGNF